MDHRTYPTEEEIRSLLYSECRALEFTARKWADARIAGAYKSIQKGSGIEFEEARLYSPGDDARRIDWKVSARKQQPYIKSFREDRDQSLFLIADVSPSSLLGINEPKINKIGEICAFLSSIAVFNQDAVGAISFYEDIVSYSPPKKGFSATLKLLHAIYKTAYELGLGNHRPSSSTPSLHSTLVSASSILKRKSIIFIISDFTMPIDFGSSLQILAKKHDVYAIRLTDQLESQIPEKGVFSVVHPETKEQYLIDFSSKKTRTALLEQIEKHAKDLKNTFSRRGIPFLSLNNNDSIRSSLFTFFQARRAAHGR
jgi:uncharacterized protein (DUF58 family)